MSNLTKPQESLKHVYFRFPPDFHQKLKTLSVKAGMTMTDFIVYLVSEYEKNMILYNYDIAKPLKNKNDTWTVRVIKWPIDLSMNPGEESAVIETLQEVIGNSKEEAVEEARGILKKILLRAR